MTKKICKICYLLLIGLFFSGHLYECFPSVIPFKINLKPSVLYQGGVQEVTILPQNGCKLIVAYFKSKKIPIKKIENNKYVLILGAGLNERAGVNQLKLIYRCNKSRKENIYVKNIVIKKKHYPKEFLKVSKKMVSFPPNILKRVLSDQRAVKNACKKINKEIYWSIPFIWPVKKDISSPFGLKRYFNNKPRSPHSGVDLRAKANTPIKSPNNGKVILVRNCYLSGKTIIIDHGGGLYTLYAHLNRVYVRKNQFVKKGQIIGLSGRTGRITGPHLHFGLSLYGTRVDPVAFMEIFGKE